MLCCDLLGWGVEQNKTILGITLLPKDFWMYPNKETRSNMNTSNTIFCQVLIHWFTLKMVKRHCFMLSRTLLNYKAMVTMQSNILTFGRTGVYNVTYLNVTCTKTKPKFIFIGRCRLIFSRIWRIKYICIQIVGQQEAFWEHGMCSNNYCDV